jgi:hypothetical protein
MPLAAPVTTATFPAVSSMIFPPPKVALAFFAAETRCQCGPRVYRLLLVDLCCACPDAVQAHRTQTDLRAMRQRQNAY